MGSGVPWKTKKKKSAKYVKTPPTLYEKPLLYQLWRRSGQRRNYTAALLLMTGKFIQKYGTSEYMNTEIYDKKTRKHKILPEFLQT